MNRLRWSDQVYRIFGYEPGDVEATNALFFEHVHPDDRARVADAVSHAVAERRAYAIAHRIVRRDGGERVVHEHAASRFNERGQPVRMTGAVQDVASSTEEIVPEAQCRILVVDDNADAVEMMSTLLELRGHEVRVAYDGASALDLAREFRPQVGLFDIGLPVMNGYDLARAVRRDPELAEMYLVAVTGWGQEEDRDAARTAGFDAHLTKPAAPETIDRLIARATARGGT